MFHGTPVRLALAILLVSVAAAAAMAATKPALNTSRGQLAVHG
jgi:hypothetical protein